jgi:F-type H+-transporting ATPase subunit delta
MLAKLVSKTRVVSARVARRSMATATEGEASGPHVYKKATKVKFNFNTPYEQVSHGEVDSVVLPGAAGVFTALPNSSATISELAPGVVRVKDGQTETKYFVSGGFAVINKDSSVAISAAEAINVDEIDVEAVRV